MMNISKIKIFSVVSILILGLFYSCDKIEDNNGSFFKPVSTERGIVADFGINSTLTQAEYDEFVNLASTNARVNPILSMLDDGEEGEQISEEYGLVSGDLMLNRIKTGSSYVVPKEDWSTRLDLELEKTSDFKIELTNASLSDDKKTYTVNYNVVALNAYQESLVLEVYTLKNNVILSNNFAVNNVLQSKTMIETVPSMSRDAVIEGEFIADVSLYPKVVDISFLFTLSNTTSKEVLQISKAIITDGGGEIIFYDKQKILIEDFTGHKCGNCPTAHVELAGLVNSYGEQIVPMAIHFGYFAEVDSEYPEDFNTQVGTAIGNEFGVQFTPIGLVNRVGGSGTGDKLIDYPAWGAEVLHQINNSPKVGIALQTTVSGADLQAKIFVKAYEEYGSNLKVQAYIVESKIHADQLWYGNDPEHIHDYEHEHVLRASINGEWGEDLTTSAFLVDEVKETTISYTLKSEWNADNLALIVIVYDAATKEIIQVEQKNL